MYRGGRCSGRRVQSRAKIKHRPHRLDRIYISQPRYFVTFATRDRASIPSLDCAQVALERYALCAIAKFNVALGRYVIMPDHVNLFVRGGRDFTLCVGWRSKACRLRVHMGRSRHGLYRVLFPPPVVYSRPFPFAAPKLCGGGLLAGKNNRRRRKMPLPL